MKKVLYQLHDWTTVILLTALTISGLYILLFTK